MKVLLIATLLMTSAFAEDKDKGAKLEDIKARITANINQRISQQQKHLSCVEGATTKEALKACQKSHKEAMKSLKTENQGERKSMKQKWKAKREERKANKKKD